MKYATVLAVCAATIAIAVSPVTLAAQAAAAAQARTIDIDGTEAMKFSVTTIQAKPGEQIRVRLKALGSMPAAAMSHNFVLLKEGVDATAFANQAMMAGATGYIPDARKADILASTKMAAGGQTVEVTFKAPTKAGTYVYLCTFPGHFASGMKGTLVVK